MKTLLLSTALVIAAVCPSAAGAATFPSGFQERTVATGLSQPTDVTWAPDGRAFMAEKGGRLKVVNPGASTATTVLDISGRVLDQHDRGLLGVEVDSQFATNRYVYLLYTYDTKPLTPDQAGAHVSRLTRIQVNPDNTLVNPSAPETVLVGSYVTGPCQTPSNTHDCIPSDEPSHSIGTVISAPDGTLWVGNGDASSFSTVDSRALRTYNEQSLAGKILHIDRNGRGLPGHPFCPTNSNTDHVCTKLHSKGFRNPFRFSLRPNGGLVVGDVGWNTREEVDLIATGAGSGGRSYGWPCYEGTVRTPGYRDLTQCAPEYAREGTSTAHLGPDYDYPHVGSSSVLGGPEYTGTQYPAGYRGTIFVGDYSVGWIKRLTLDSQGRVSGTQDFAGGWSGTDLEADLDGNLTYPSFGTGAPGTGSLRRIVYSPGNRQPTAVAGANPASGAAPLTVQFSSTGSSDPDGDSLSYSWDFGDGSPAGSGASPSHVYTASGNYTARLTVSDGRGLTATDTVLVSVGDAAPTATIETPLDESGYRGGQAVTLRGSATDAQDGTLPGSALDWQVRLIHVDHVHLLGSFNGTAQTSFTPVQDHDADSYYEIALTATDSAGLKDTKTIQIRPETASLTLASTPAGAPLSYAGRDVTAPFSTQAAIGFRTSVSAATEFVSGGRLWRFDSWSDGGARLHDVTIPATASTLTARYTDAGPANPAGLVAAYGFEEGTGTTVADLSGGGNTGTISGAAWTTGGRYGKALSFDGVNDWVTVPDSNSLDLTAGMTLSAWVRPDALGDWRTAILKERPGDLAYALYPSTSSGNRPNGEAGIASLYGPSPIPAGAWTHVATTYDGTNLRLFVNGAEVASKVQAVPIPASSMPLRIGGNSIWGEWFDGLIDDVRVYNRALTAAEMQADRDTGLGGAPPPPVDNTPPTVAVTAPAGGSTVGGTVNVTANASDNVGVSGVRFRVDGENLGGEDTAAPYSVPWDTATAANGSHQLTAVARDAAGNTQTSSTVTVTVQNGTPPPPTGLVAAYSFNEGAGATANDSSAAGTNDGAVAGATWAPAGRNGAALSFDGVDDRVNVPDANSLDLTSGMTLEAWVRPTTLSSWRTIILKETASNLAYALYGSTHVSSRPNAEAGSGSLFGPSALPLNAWTHIATTYDRTTLRLFINGTQVSSTPLTVLMPTSTSPLRIGGNAIWGEWFHGLIDDVRIYSRALTPAEITADRDRGV
jgi:PKD repeat protein/glucose/arabinose dehydrogenase